MKLSLQERIALLKKNNQTVQPIDVMAEAGRKVLLTDWIKMLECEAGSRTGEDIEDVHDMRVSIRRMRSLLRLLRPYYDEREAKQIRESMRRIGLSLGVVRDLDVLLENLHTYQLTQEAEQQAALQEVIDDLEARRVAARAMLVILLDSKFYRRFVKSFSEFLLTPEAGVSQVKTTGVVPSQIRHLLPVLVHDRLAAVRAYDSILAEADALTLHGLRIECKRLRYTVSLFSDLLGDTHADYVTEVKILQDCLGHMNDVATARLQLDTYLDSSHNTALAPYFAHMEAQEAEQKAKLSALWTHFNSRKVQQKLVTALLALH
jgi:CHAD domain-containing protein